MASNIFSVIPYQINQRTPIPLASTYQVGLPTTGVSVQDITNSPTRSLSTGVNTYTLITALASGTEYYTSLTYAAVIALINA